MAKYTPVSGIYVILNTKNGKVYIGQTQDFRQRWRTHQLKLNKGSHPNQHLQSAWIKYGSKFFKFKVLEYCLAEELNEREQHYLDTYIVKGICYNIATDSTSPSRNPTIETRQKIGNASKGRFVSEETRRKISASLKGKKVTEETRQKLSIANTGKKASLESRIRNSEAHKGIATRIGHKATDETRKKQSDAAKNRPPISKETRRKLSEANKGKRTSVETRQKLSKALKNRVISEETRYRMSEAAKLRHSRKRANLAPPDDNE